LLPARDSKPTDRKIALKALNVSPTPPIDLNRSACCLAILIAGLRVHRRLPSQRRSIGIDGVVTVIQIADKLMVLAASDFKEKIFATPALAENQVYLRTEGHLCAFGK